jgi:hypothetical protein
VRVLRASFATAAAVLGVTLGVLPAQAATTADAGQSGITGTSFSQKLTIETDPGPLGHVRWDSNFVFTSGAGSFGTIGYDSGSQYPGFGSGLTVHSFWKVASATDCRIPTGSVGVCGKGSGKYDGLAIADNHELTSMRYDIARAEQQAAGDWWSARVTDLTNNKQYELGQLFIRKSTPTNLVWATFAPSTHYLDVENSAATCAGSASSSAVFGPQIVDGKSFVPAADPSGVSCGSPTALPDGSTRISFDNPSTNASNTPRPIFSRDGYALDVEGGGTPTPGQDKRVGLWRAPTSLPANELFAFAGDGTLRSQSRCISTSTTSSVVTQSDCTGAATQQWLSLASGQIYNVGRGECLNADGPGGTYPIHTLKCTTATEQRWNVLLGTTNQYKLINRNSGQALDYDSAAGASVQQPASVGSQSQLFQFRLDANGKLVIVTAVANGGTNGSALDVPGSSSTPGTGIIHWSVNGGANQSWELRPTTNGDVVIVNQSSGQAMDVSGGSHDPGTAVIQWTVNGGANQSWRLTPAGSSS